MEKKHLAAGSSVKKIAIFVDVQNIYYTTRDSFGRQFNYRKFWQTVSRQGEIVSAIAYAIDRGDEHQRKFQNALKHIGFTVKLKPYIQRSDGSAKGDWDVGITIDIMDIAKEVEVDVVILLSGDGDFELLLKKIKSDYRVYTEVYGVPALTANALIESADSFHAIDEDLLQ
ncbi:MAG: NYN domain-containing protein [Spirochaetales bacterium]|jgi:uncharacterized LabA/DUF88 family protein|nr:NYN domain-containing protein [Spirochaetales bacterium]